MGLAWRTTILAWLLRKLGESDLAIRSYRNAMSSLPSDDSSEQEAASMENYQMSNEVLAAACRARLLRLRADLEAGRGV